MQQRVLPRSAVDYARAARPLAGEEWDLSKGVKGILAGSSRRDWEAQGLKLWRYKGDPGLVVADLTDDDYAAREPGGRLVEFSIFRGSRLVAKVDATSVNGGGRFVPRNRPAPRWHFDLCRIVSPRAYLGPLP